jgi:hypothetical protein
MSFSVPSANEKDWRFPELDRWQISLSLQLFQSISLISASIGDRRRRDVRWVSFIAKGHRERSSEKVMAKGHPMNSAMTHQFCNTSPYNVRLIAGNVTNSAIPPEFRHGPLLKCLEAFSAFQHILPGNSSFYFFQWECAIYWFFGIDLRGNGLPCPNIVMTIYDSVNVEI